MKTKILLFATSNSHKLEELADILQKTDFKVKGLTDVGIFEEIPETGSTLKENALIKALYLYQRTGLPVLAEDTGLEVDVLNGAPGVYTARYAGEQKNPDKNMDKLIKELGNNTNRTARFRTVIVFYDGEKAKYFEGVAEGKIAFQKSGTGGFGYDPVFIPNGFNITFADLGKEIKNSISHRAKAIKALLEYFNISEK